MRRKEEKKEKKEKKKKENKERKEKNEGRKRGKKEGVHDPCSYFLYVNFVFFLSK